MASYLTVTFPKPPKDYEIEGLGKLPGVTGVGHGFGDGPNACHVFVSGGDAASRVTEILSSDKRLSVSGPTIVEPSMA